MRVTLAKGSAETSRAQVLLVPVTNVSGTLSPWWGTPSEIWAQPLRQWLKQIRFNANALDNELCPQPGHPGRLILFVGLGDVTRLNPGRFVKALSAGLRRVRHLSAARLEVILQTTDQLTIPAREIVPLAVRALHTGTYELGSTPSPTRSRTYRLLVDRLTEADRQQLRAEDRIGEVLHRVRALANEPGNTATPGQLTATGPDFPPEQVAAFLPPIGRQGTPDDIAAGVLFLASDASAFMTGQTLVMDGGALTC